MQETQKVRRSSQRQTSRWIKLHLLLLVLWSLLDHFAESEGAMRDAIVLLFHSRLFEDVRLRGNVCCEQLPTHCGTFLEGIWMFGDSHRTGRNKWRSTIWLVDQKMRKEGGRCDRKCIVALRGCLRQRLHPLLNKGFMRRLFCFHFVKSLRL